MRLARSSVATHITKEIHVAVMTPEQAHYLLHNFFLGSMKNESRTTKKVLEAVPADNISYQPDPCAKSANELLRHIAVSDLMFLETVLNGVFNPSAVAIPEDVNTPAEVAAWYEQGYAKRFEALTKLTGEELSKIVDSSSPVSFVRASNLLA